MMMVAQLLHWEAELAHEIVPAGAVPRTLNAIVSATVNAVVDAGYALASGRPSPEKLFPLLDGIVCMHDPFVQPIMKQAFKVEALKPLKEKFHDLLAHLNLQARHCVDSFSAAIANNPAPLKRDTGANTTVAQQTAFVLRFLKVCMLTCSVPGPDQECGYVLCGLSCSRSLFNQTKSLVRFCTS